MGGLPVLVPNRPDRHHSHVQIKTYKTESILPITMPEKSRDKLDVLFISPWKKRGGIATYSQYLVPKLRSNSKITVFPWDHTSLVKRGLGIPLISHDFYKQIKRADVVHIQYTPVLYFLSLPAIFMLCKVTGTRGVLTQHERFNTLPYPTLVYIYHQIVYFLADSIIVHTKPRKELIWSPHHSKVSVIKHGIIERENIDREPSSIETILIPGIIRDAKGHHLVIRSLNRIEDIELRIVGSIDNNDYFEFICNLDKKLNVDERINWTTDFVPEQQLFDEIQNTDLVVLPYEVDTAMSGILCHCISWQVPTILSDSPTFRSVVSSDDVFLENRSSESIAVKIRELDSDCEKQRDIIDEFKEISANNSWEKVAAKTSQVYFDIHRK